VSASVYAVTDPQRTTIARPARVTGIAGGGLAASVEDGACR